MDEISFILRFTQIISFTILCLRFRPTLFWVISMATIPTLSLFHPGSYESGDFTTHIVRAMDLHNSLQFGIFPVRWASLLQGGYGYPLFSFMASLPYYVLSGFHAFNISFVIATKLYLSSVYVGSAVTMWYFARSLFSQHKKATFIATISAVFYVFAPYTLINLEFRAAIGELTGFLLVPLILYAVLEKRSMLFCSSLALLFLSHPGITLLATPWIALLGLIKKRWSFIFPALLAVGLASFYVLPMFFESNFTQQAQHAAILWTKDTIPGFQPISWLLWSPWRYGLLFQGHYGEIAYVIGLGQLAFIGCLIIFIRLKKIQPIFLPTLLIFLFILSIGVYMMLPASLPVWNALSVLRKLQFPSRLMFYIAISTAVLCGYTLSQIHFKRITIGVILLILLGWTALNWSQRTFLTQVNDEYLRERIHFVSFEYERLPEAMPIVQKEIWEPRNSPYAIHNKEALVEVGEQTPIIRSYRVRTDLSTVFQEYTMYFPGWIAVVNETEVPIRVTDIGTMVIDLPKGESEIHFKFLNTPIRRSANIISVVAVAIFTLWCLKNYSSRYLYTS
jgi:hypothetical protein